MADAKKAKETVTVDVTTLSSYKWWQIKKHRTKGEQVYSCTIQDLKENSKFYSATDTDLATAITKAVIDAVAEKSSS